MVLKNFLFCNVFKLSYTLCAWFEQGQYSEHSHQTMDHVISSLSKIRLHSLFISWRILPRYALVYHSPLPSLGLRWRNQAYARDECFLEKKEKKYYIWTSYLEHMPFVLKQYMFNERINCLIWLFLNCFEEYSYLLV